MVVEVFGRYQLVLESQDDKEKLHDRLASRHRAEEGADRVAMPGLSGGKSSKRHSGGGVASVSGRFRMFSACTGRRIKSATASSIGGFVVFVF